MIDIVFAIFHHRSALSGHLRHGDQSSVLSVFLENKILAPGFMKRMPLPAPGEICRSVGYDGEPGWDHLTRVCFGRGLAQSLVPTPHSCLPLVPKPDHLCPENSLLADILHICGYILPYWTMQLGAAGREQVGGGVVVWTANGRSTGRQSGNLGVFCGLITEEQWCHLLKWRTEEMLQFGV